MSKRYSKNVWKISTKSVQNKLARVLIVIIFANSKTNQYRGLYNWDRVPSPSRNLLPDV